MGVWGKILRLALNVGGMGVVKCTWKAVQCNGVVGEDGRLGDGRLPQLGG